MKEEEKIIFMYWGQKFINAPFVVKKCLSSWKLKNPTWRVIELDDDNLNEYINIEEEIPNIKDKKIKKASYSDIIRILLLANYGGCWCDATTFCTQSLDDWLNKNISTGFFGFDKPGPDRLLSSWFLYGEKNNYIIKKWKEKTVLFWNNNNHANDYFWFHYLFGNLYNSDDKFKELWDLTPKISADGPHYVLFEGLVKKLSNNVKSHIDEIKIPVYKLTYEYNDKLYNENCNLSYLLNKSNNLFENNFKHIFIIWFQGFDNMPEICRACYNSWKYKNPDWKIHFIDNSNKNQYIDVVNLSYIRNFSTLTTQSDLVKCYLLGKYGGIYTDITNYCNISLDRWINNLNYIDNIWFHWDFDSILPTFNFFICKSKNNIFNDIYNEIIKDKSLYEGEYLRIIKKFFNIMPKNLKLLKENQIGKSSNNTNPKQGVKIISNFKLMNENNDNNFDTTLDKYPFFKLTYKDVPSGKLTDIFHQNSKLTTLINYHTKNLKFIHIGKCGGTNVNAFLKKLAPQYHLKRDYNDNEKYFIWLRNPITRFVSAFYMSYNLINLDTNNLDINNLSLDNCLAPMRVKHKMIHNITFTKRYDYLINYFKTANELAESITSENIEKKELALELMNSTNEHIFKGIGWYLYNGDFIEKNHHKIIFVGTTENMQEDLMKLGKLLNIKFDTIKQLRKNLNNNDKYLSPKAIQNIINFYNDTDYKALQKLVDYNFITKDLFEKYHHYI